MKRRIIFQSYTVVLGYIGIFLMLIGGILLLPLLCLFAYPNELDQAKFFLIPAAIAILLGWLLKHLLKGEKEHQLTLRQDAVIVTGVWLLAAFFSALPFMLSQQLNFTQAYFEAVSGWTTTGLSVVDVTVTPKVFLMHRSIMLFFGGVGLILVMLSALSATYGMNLYSAEGHSDFLLPNLAKSARLIISIYAGYIVAGTFLYVVFGMPLFDAINHSIASLSTGGFSTVRDSIGTYKSFPIELISIVLMLLGTTNFFAHLILIKGKVKSFVRLSEVRFMFLLIGFCTPIAAFLSLNNLYGSISEGMRVSFFQIVSALTTTGFSTVYYNDWAPLPMLIMIVLMIIGGGAGSTAGGIKLSRFHLLIKSLWWQIKSKFLPENVIQEYYVYRPEGKVYVGYKTMSETALFAVLYLIIFIIGTSILLFHGYSLQDSLFEFSSALGTVGLSIGITLPSTPPVVLWTETFGMLLGRLEIYVVIFAVIKVIKDTKTVLLPCKR